MGLKILSSSYGVARSFHALTSNRRRMVIKSLNQAERKELIKIISHQGTLTSLKTCRSIKEKISIAEHTSLSVAKTDTRRTRIKKGEVKFKHFIGTIASLFGYITERKVHHTYQGVFGKNRGAETDLFAITSKNQLRQLVNQYRLIPIAKRPSFSSFLKEQGLPKQIKGIEIRKSLFKEIDLQGIEFKECRFIDTNFSRSTLRKVQFQSCTFENCPFVKTTLKECEFVGCQLQETMFVGSKLDRVVFDDTVIKGSSFENAELREVTFNRVEMPGTHFLQAEVSGSAITNSDLQDVVFCDAKEKFSIDKVSKRSAVITRPVVAVLIAPENRGISVPKAYIKLDQSAGMIPIRISETVIEADPEKIQREMEAALSDIPLYGPMQEESKSHQEMVITDSQEAFSLSQLEDEVRDVLGESYKPTPVPQQILSKIKENPSDYLAASMIREKAKCLASHVDAFFLPGGEDIAPALYGAQEEAQTTWAGDYRRGLLELMMIEQGHQKGIPLMGVCRGFQMINVYFGARLAQHVPGHKGLQRFQFMMGPEDGSLYRGVLPNAFTSPVFHHQGIIDDPKYLAKEHIKTSVTNGGLVKGVEPIDGGTSPIIGIQFHPEFYDTLSASSVKHELKDKLVTSLMSGAANEQFWKVFGRSGQTYHQKRKAHKELLEARKEPHTLARAG